MQIEVNDQFDKSTEEANVIDNLVWFLGKAESLGLIVTVDRQPLLPLAMGHHTAVVTVRREIDHVGDAAKRGGYAK